jgi:RecA/RadA recombinase
VTADRARLVRLERLERMRAIAKRTAALEAAQAEQARAQLAALSERTGQLVAACAHGDAQDAWALRNALGFAGRLHELERATSDDAKRAGRLADDSMAELAATERRRAVVADRVAEQARRIEGQPTPSLSAPRRSFGTGLE